MDTGLASSSMNWIRTFVTNFKLSRVCDLIDRIYEAEGQVVAMMNKSPEDLAAKWGENEAGTILRRIGGEHGPLRWVTQGCTVRFEQRG